MPGYGIENIEARENAVPFAVLVRQGQSQLVTVYLYQPYNLVLFFIVFMTDSS